MTPRHPLSSFLAAAAVTGAVASASAQIAQPDGTLVPDQTTSGDYFDTSRYNVNTLGLGTMLTQLEGGQVDYRADAATDPAVFSPLCGLKGSMIMRGGSCNMDFGWYCIDHVPTSNTDPNFVPLVTVAQVQAYHDALVAPNDRYKNNDRGFVPLIGLPPVNGTPLDAVRDHAVFQNCPSKQIGFAIMPSGVAIPSVGNPVCTQPKYSQRALNMVHAASGQPWINALVYASVQRPGVFYIAFEDMPNSATAFLDTTKVPAGWTRDSDFNDFVYMVEGIQCEGGGQICNTGSPGLCSIGVTECTIDGTPGACTPKFTPSGETCDNVDNDCDGVVDNGEGLCPDPIAPRCFEGTCVGSCGGGEFACPAGYSCDEVTDLCVKSDCLGITCPAGERCVAGACQGGCTNVVCAAGKECVAGTCVDLCQGQVCPEGFICQKGACIADCRCLPCAAGYECGADGKCFDSACVGVTCDPGLKCVAGACVDPCATCLAPNVCTADGDCLPPGSGSGGTPGVGGSIEGTGGGLVVPTGGIGNGTGSTGVAPKAPSSDAGCACRTSETGSSAAALGALALLGLVFARRRRSV